MDLPTCPACKQSVLDDDAEYCPFCGASMSGKPGKGPVAPAPAKKSTPTPTAAEKPAAASPDAKPKKSASTTKTPADGDDDPFAAKPHSGEAVPVSRKKTPARTFAVKCPMCDSAGFVPLKAANKEVKCWNPDCMVPIFTAPPPPEAPPPPPPPPPPKTNVLVLGIVLGLLVSAGVAAFIILDPFAPPPPPVVAPVFPPAVNPGNPDEVETETPDETTDDLPPKPKTISDVDLRKEILEGMVQASLSKENNRSKPFCRRLTGVAFALSGDLAGAQKQIEAIQNVGSNVPFFQINPEVAIAWALLAKGDSAGAKAAVDRAAAVADTIPQFGRDPLEIILELATAMAAVDRADDARNLFQNRDFQKPAGKLAALFVLNREIAQYDFADRPPAGLVAGWEAPAEVVVTVGLAAHGQWEAARKWAENAPEGSARIECLIAWGEMLTRNRLANGETSVDPVLLEVAKSLPPGRRARFLSLIALPLVAHGEQAPAQSLLGDAEAAVNSIPSPEIPEFSGFAELAAFKLPDAEPLKHAALGAAEIAHLRAKMEQPGEAATYLVKSLAFCRGIAPSPLLTGAQDKDISSLGTTIARSQLKDIFDLNSDDEARRKLNELRRKLTDIDEAAKARFELETRILAAAMTWGLLDAVRDEILRSAQQTDVALQEPWLKTPLPERLLALYRESGNVDGGDLLAELLRGQPPVPDEAYQLRQKAIGLIRAGKIQEVFKIIDQFGSDGQAAPLELAGRLAAQVESPSPLTEFKTLSDPLLREDVFRLIAARAARNRDPAQVWKSTEELALSQTERVAVGLGIIEGMLARNRGVQETTTASP